MPPASTAPLHALLTLLPPPLPSPTGTSAGDVDLDSLAPGWSSLVEQLRQQGFYSVDLRALLAAQAAREPDFEVGLAAVVVERVVLMLWLWLMVTVVPG